MTYQGSPLLARKYTLPNGRRNDYKNTYTVNTSNLQRNMGTAASSNGLHKPSQTSTLPGGNDISSCERNYRYYNNKNNHDRFMNRDNIFGSGTKIKSSPRTTAPGPLKANHNIGVNSKEHQSFVSTTRHAHLSPLSKRKSRSLTDLSLHNHTSTSSDDDTPQNRKPNQGKSRYGFNITRDSTISDLKNSGVRKGEEILNSAKLKLAQLSDVIPTSTRLHRRYGSSNDLDAVTDRIKKVNLLNGQKPMDKECYNSSRKSSVDSDSYLSKEYSLNRRASLDLSIDNQNASSRKDVLHDMVNSSSPSTPIRRVRLKPGFHLWLKRKTLSNLEIQFGNHQLAENYAQLILLHRGLPT